MFPIKYSWNFVKFDMLHMELNFKTARVRYNDIKYFLKESINHWNGIEIYYRFILSFWIIFLLNIFQISGFGHFPFSVLCHFPLIFLKISYHGHFPFDHFPIKGIFMVIEFISIEFIFFGRWADALYFPGKKYYCLWKQRVFKRERIVLKL